MSTYHYQHAGFVFTKQMIYKISQPFQFVKLHAQICSSLYISDCLLTKILENGNAHEMFSTNVTAYQTGEKVRLSCKNGFRLQGHDTITCLSNGEWDAIEPVCERGNISVELV